MHRQNTLTKSHHRCKERDWHTGFLEGGGQLRELHPRSQLLQRTFSKRTFA